MGQKTDDLQRQIDELRKEVVELRVLVLDRVTREPAMPWTFPQPHDPFNYTYPSTAYPWRSEPTVIWFEAGPV